MKVLVAAMLMLALAAAPALAQQADKPTVSNYLLQGYDVLHIEGGSGQFLFFILRKDRALVHCSVLLQSGETSSCRPIK